MGDGSVDGKGRSQPDPHDHEPDLVDHGVGKDAPKIVFDDGIEDGERRHGDPHPDQQVRAGEGSGQGIDRHLGGEGREKDRTRRSRFRIGIHQPVVKEGEAGLDPEGQENEPGC